MLLRKSRNILAAGLSLILLASIGKAEEAISVGIAGRSRAGMWTECRINSEKPLSNVVVSTLDGDGVAVDYRVETDPSGNDCICYFQDSPIARSLQIVGTDTGGNEVGPIVTPSPVAVPYNQFWILSIGEEPLVGASRSSSGFQKAPEVTQILGAEELPSQWIGYNGVDLLILVTSNAEILDNLSDQQWDALTGWVQSGGRVLVTLGAGSTASSRAIQWLQDSLNLSVSASDIVEYDSRDMETFTNAQSRLENYRGLRLPADEGKTLLKGRSVDRKPAILAQEHLIGLGRVLLISADLDQAPFSNWDSRQDLIERFYPDLFGRGVNRGSQDIADVGYSDIVGQIRRAIDQFQSRLRIPFKWIAGILAVYLLMIGPFDYVLVNRWLGKPMLGWITSGLIILGFCGLAVYGSTLSTPDTSTINQINVVDVNPSTKTGRAFTWSQYLNRNPAQLDFQGVLTSPLASQASDPVLGWWGMPGTEFGGLASTGRDRRLPKYQIELSREDSGQVSSSIKSLPLATSASKGIASHWKFKTDLSVSSSLQEHRGTDLLKGKFRNPLDCDLQNGMLLYHGWVYVLPTRLESETEIDVERVTGKNLKWRLTRGQVRDNAVAALPWDPEMDDDLERIMELALFYRVAGGVNYMELENRLIRGLDLSYVLESNHAILVGQVAEPESNVIVDGNAVQNTTSLNYVRILLPVDTKSN